MTNDTSLQNLAKGILLGGVGFAICFGVLRLLIVPILVPLGSGLYLIHILILIGGLILYLVTIPHLGKLAGYALGYMEADRTRYMRPAAIAFLLSPGILMWLIWGLSVFNYFGLQWTYVWDDFNSVPLAAQGTIVDPSVCGLAFGSVIGIVFGGIYGWLAYKNVLLALATGIIGLIGFGLAGLVAGGVFPFYSCFGTDAIVHFYIWATPWHAMLFGFVGGAGMGLFQQYTKSPKDHEGAVFNE